MKRILLAAMLSTLFVVSQALAGASSKPSNTSENKPKSPYDISTAPKKAKPKTLVVSPGGLKDMKKPIAAVPHQYLISFQKDMTDEQCRAFLTKKNVKVLEKVGSTLLYLIEVKEDSKSEVEATLEMLRGEKEVRYVEANAMMQTFGN